MVNVTSASCPVDESKYPMSTWKWREDGGDSGAVFSWRQFTPLNWPDSDLSLAWLCDGQSQSQSQTSDFFSKTGQFSFS